jgi:PAS domain S-box-containing protein
MPTMKDAPKVPSLLTVLVFGSLTAVVLLLVIAHGLRSDLRAQLDEANRRAGEAALSVAQAVRLPLRSSANSVTFVAEEANRLHRTAPEQSDVLLNGLIAEVLRRQPQILKIDIVATPASVNGAAASVGASCGTALGTPCFGAVTNAADGRRLSIAAPLDAHGWVVAQMQLAAVERASENVPHVGEVWFKVVDAQGQTVARKNDGASAGSAPETSVAPWWIADIFGVRTHIPLSATAAVEPYPFKVVASLTYQQALVPWHRQMLASLGFYFLYLCAFVALLSVMYRATKVQRYYIQSLRAKTEELHTAQRVGRTAIWSLAGRHFECTDEVGEIFGLPYGRSDASVLQFLARVLPPDRPALVHQVKAAWESGAVLRAEFRIRSADGAVRCLSAAGQLMTDQAGAKRMAGTVVDVTEQWEASQRQAESEQRFHSLFEQNPLPFWVFDIATLKFLEVNAAAMKAYGYTREEFLAMTILDIREVGDRPDVLADLEASSEARDAPRVWVHRTKSGKSIEVRVHAADIVFNGIQARLVLAEDVGRQLAGERELAFRASHDPVTRLPNQHALLKHLDALIAHGRAFHVAYLQLLGLDAIADTFGISVSAGIVQAMAVRLGERIGGDELLATVNHEAFAWVAPPERMSETNLQSIIQCATEPVYYEETQHQIDIIVGVASHPQDGQQSDVLFGCAALAAHAHIRSGQPIHAFVPSLAQESKERLHFAASLRRAVRRNEFEMHFQPITNYPDMRLIGLEALIRWPQGDGSFIPPSTFIPICEESGLIVPLGRWVLNQVAKASLRLQEAGFERLPIGMNISPAELRSGDLVSNLRAVRDAYALPSHAINIELTESCLIEHREKAIDVMSRLRDDGVAVALDDFGSGFSSLSYLRDLPIEILKIDQAFIRNVDWDARSATICEAIIALGKSLKVRVIAEGIERASQYRWLHQHGCDGAQGYYLGRPEPLADILRRWSPTTTEHQRVTMGMP